MLVLTRKIGESIVIGEKGEIKISILGSNGCQVRLGIEAPKNITVHREEVHERILAERKAGKVITKRREENGNPIN